MFDSSKRKALRLLTALGGAGAAMLSGIFPFSVFAARPDAAFEADDMAAAAQAVFGSSDAEQSGEITLKAPDIAENGAVVPISVSTSIAGVTSIALLVEKNPSPLAASFDISSNGVADVSTRIKMGETSNVVAMVQADGKLYQTAKEVKVTIGGCGG